MLKCAELTEVVRKNDQGFVNVLKSSRISTVDEKPERLSKAKFIDQSDKTYPYDVLYIHTESSLTVLRNQPCLKNQSIEANDKIPDDCRYPFSVIQAPQTQKQTNTGGLAKFPQLKIGTKGMLTVSIDIQDHFIMIK